MSAMTQARSSAVLLAVAGLLTVDDAGAQISSEFHRIDCTGYALEVMPPEGEFPERYCYEFDALGGHRVEALCSGHGWIGFIGGPPYNMGCAVMIGPRNGDAFSVQQSASNGWAAVLNYTIPQVGTYLAEVMFWGRLSLFVDEHVRVNRAGSPPCVPDATSMCLGAGRFRVSADWQAPDGGSGHAPAVALTGDAGYFSFFDPSNVEVVVKVLDGCALGGSWWLFAAGLTDVQVALNVTDEASGASRSYVNPMGRPFAPVQDTAAFPCP